MILSLHSFLRRRAFLAAGLCAASVTLTPVAHAEPPKVVESQTAATAGRATLSVTENESVKTIEADGRDVSIDGNRNKITVSGPCHALTVSGNENHVTLEKVATISTPGNRNLVTYTGVVGGETAQVTNLGSGNEIKKKAE